MEELSQKKAADPLALPSPEVLRDIAAKQDARAKAIRVRRAQQVQCPVGKKGNEIGMGNGVEQSDAAQLIQRNYRGYRERRQLEGFGLDPGTRWLEV